MSLRIAAVALIIAASGLVAAQDLSKVPPQCLTDATNLQQACQAEIQKALSSAGSSTSPTTTDLSSITQAVNQVVQSGQAGTLIAQFNPSKSCCAAACKFAADLCLCNQAVVDTVRQFINVDTSTTNALLSRFAASCGFKETSLTSSTCPPAGTAAPAFTCPSRKRQLMM